MVNLDWYRTFAAVYRAGTMTAAAKQLFLTQPAVTQQIAGLEAALGEPLFIRAARRLAPTERAKSLYVQIAPALERLDGATQTQALGEKTEVLTLLLGAPLEYFTEVALGKLQSLAAQLNVRFDRTQQLLEALAQRELDAVIATQRLPTRDVDFIKIADERFVLVGSAKLKPPAYAIPKTTHKRTLAQIEAWLLQQHWVSYGAELPIIRRFWQQAFGHRPDLTPALVLPNLHAVRNAVALGMGISLIPDYMSATSGLSGKLHVLWEPAQPVTNELWLACRKAERGGRAVQMLQGALTTK